MKSENIPTLIKELRTRLELTQEQFAQKIGVTYSTVNHWENGKRAPLPFLAKRLVEMKEELDSRDKKQAKKSPR
jgi:DNA-binding transcriptional regulator YiaG